jgi:hypothetical protein
LLAASIITLIFIILEKVLFGYKSDVIYSFVLHADPETILTICFVAPILVWVLMLPVSVFISSSKIGRILREHHDGIKILSAAPSIFGLLFISFLLSLIHIFLLQNPAPRLMRGDFVGILESEPTFNLFSLFFFFSMTLGLQMELRLAQIDCTYRNLPDDIKNNM